jgi:signal transduction histidine kinase/putative methionine-R-sulfoxide reductase with GAF domain
VDYLQRFFQLEQPEEEAARLRKWLIIVEFLLLACAVGLSALWFFLGRRDFSTPPIFVSLPAVLGFLLGLFLAWRWRIWQSALLVSLLIIVATAFTFWEIPIFSNMLVSLYAINLIFVSIYLSRRVMTLYAVFSLFVIFALNFLKSENGFDLNNPDWLLILHELIAVAIFVMAYVFVWLNNDVNEARSTRLLASEARYRLLFEASPISLWEQDGSDVLVRIEQLRQEGVLDFRTYFQQNPSILAEMMSAVKVLNVNTTAVSMYKARDKSELMDNLDRFLPEESYEFALDSLAAMANHEPYFEREITNMTLEGEKLTVLYRWAIPPGQEDTTYTTVVASIVDVSAQKQVEDALQNYSERLRSLHELDLAINIEKSPEEMAQVALKFVGQFVPFCGSEVWSHDEEGQIVTLLAQQFSEEGWERPLQEPNQSVATMLSEEMQDDMRNNQVYVVEDLWSLRYLPPTLSALKKAGMHSFMQIPLLVRAKPIGYLRIYDKGVDTYTPEYMGIARELAVPLAIALGNVQLYLLENVARNQAEILRRVAADLNTSLEVEPLLENILEYLQEVIPFDSATIFLAREGTLKIVSQRGLPQTIEIDQINRVNRQLAARAIFDSGEAQIISDTKLQPDWEIVPGMEYIRCWMGIPLKVKGKTIGVLTLDKSVARFYTEKNQDLALAFANQAAVAIENARLYQRSLQYAEDLESRVDERTRDLMTLYEITAVASTHLELDKILDESLKILLDTLNCVAGALLIKDENGDFELKSHIGVPDEFLSMVSVFEHQDGLVRQSVDDHRPLFIRDLADSPSLKALSIPEKEFSYAGVSIRVKKQVVGILSVIHSGGIKFSTEDLALLTSVADQLGVVIENFYLHQQNQEMAVLQERERLARELHDSVTQSLYSLTLFAEASRDLSKTENGEKLRAVLDDIGTTAQQALREMRLMLYELQTGALGEEGLVNALRYRLEAVEGRSGIDANIEAQLDVDIPTELRRTLYLIAQEALNNTLKHAKATEVFVNLSMQGSKLIMIIEDNGRGFSERTLASGGMGLKTMRHRIEAVGGNLHINSLPGVGTKIELSIDLEKYGVT